MSGRFGRNDPRVTDKGELLTLSKLLDLENSIDNFGYLISRGTSNKGDIGSEYPFTPERLRLYEDNQRVFVQYGENPLNTEGNTILDDAVDSWYLRPSQDSIVRMTTAERFRYIVGYVVTPSFAFGLNTTLSAGDKVVIGYGESDLENDMTDADGWFFIFTPDLDPREVEIAEYRLGTKVASEIVTLNKALTIWKRMAMKINWYNVGADIFQETYSSRGKQYNPTVGELDITDGKGPSSANKRVEFAVKRGAGNPPLELEVGSIGVETLGPNSGGDKSKTSSHEYTFSTTNAWIPILAFRTKPTYFNVFSELEEIIITEWTGNSDVKMCAQAIDPTKIRDSGGNPILDSDYQDFVEHNGINSSLEYTNNVAQFPDSTGTIVSSTPEATGVGGYQIGFSTFNTSAQGQSKTGTSRFVKRAVNDTDVVVIFGLAESTSTAEYLLVTEQDF